MAPAAPGLRHAAVANLRIGGLTAPEDEHFAELLSALAELQRQGLVRNIGLSTISPRQLVDAAASPRFQHSPHPWDIVGHPLRENLAAARLSLPPDAIAQLDRIALPLRRLPLIRRGSDAA